MRKKEKIFFWSSNVAYYLIIKTVLNKFLALKSNLIYQQQLSAVEKMYENRTAQDCWVGTKSEHYST